MKKKRFTAAYKDGLRGMLIGFLWISLSFLLLCIFEEGSGCNHLIKSINWLLLSAAAGSLFDYLVRIGLANKHDAIFLLVIVFMVYLIAGYLFGCVYYYIRKAISKC